MRTRTLYIALLMTLLVSCMRDQEVEVDVPQKSKLVAALYVGADASSVMAWVTRSQPVIGTPYSSYPESPNYVSNASGTLTRISTGRSWPFTYLPETFQYETGLDTETIKAGEQYRVRFSDDYETVEGITTVPLPVDAMISIKIDSFTDVGFITRWTAAITCTSQSEGLRNFRLVPVMIFTDSTPGPMTNPMSLSENVVSLRKGESVTQNFISQFYSDQQTPARIAVAVLACDEAYMKYHNAARFTYDQFGPYADPAIVYSNMSNNIGVIASYNVSFIHSFPVR